MNAKNAQDIISTMREAGAQDSDSIIDALCDGEALEALGIGDEDQEAVEEAYAAMQEVVYFVALSDFGTEQQVFNIKKDDEGDYFVDSFSSYPNLSAEAIFTIPFLIKGYKPSAKISELVDGVYNSNVHSLLKEIASKIEAIQDETGANCDGHLDGGEILDKNVSSVMMESAISKFEF